MKFRSERYPRLKVRVESRYVSFVDGEYETTDKAQIDALKGLPDHLGVTAVSGRSKADKGEE